MKTKYYLIPILLGTLVILYSITPKPVYAAEGGTYKSKEISCTCNYGPHANEQGKRNECNWKLRIPSFWKITFLKKMENKIPQVLV